MPASTPEAPEDSQALHLVHQGWQELAQQRPLAAWAAWQQALRGRPGDPAASRALDLLEGSSMLPLSARAAYRFLPPRDEVRRARWDTAFRSRVMTDLIDATRTFTTLAMDDPGDAAAVFNLALCLAWLGRNLEAINALEQFLRLKVEEDFDGAANSWTLAEVLRHGAGAEVQADDLSATLLITDPDGILNVDSLDEPGLIQLHPISTTSASGQPTDSGRVAYEWLDRAMPPVSMVRSSDDLPICLANVIRGSDTIEITTSKPWSISKIEARLATILGSGVSASDWSLTPLPLQFLDASVWTFRLPTDLELSTRLILSREAIERFFEEEWIHVPRLSLGVHDEFDPSQMRPRTPLESSRASAAGDLVARAKLEGVIRLREQLAARPHMAALSSGYPFDRLRRRLGLPLRAPSNIDPEDVTCAGEAELATWRVDSLDDSTLEEAIRSASTMRRSDLAANFGRHVTRAKEESNY